jgi:crotonobetaine/carnitine-CoA ligase
MTTGRVIGDVLRERAREHPEHPYLWSGDEQVTYGEMDARSDRVAAGLAALGVGPGDRVAIISSNRMEMIDVFFAVAKLGAVQVPLNAFLKGEFLKYQLEDSQAQTLLVDGPGLQALTAVLEDLPSLRRLVVLEEPQEQPAGLDVIAYEGLRSSNAALPSAEVHPSSLMSILYTSGTTGMPKGCMLPHGWYLNGATVSSEMVEYGPDDVPFTALPLFHAWAQGTVIGAMVHHLRGVVDPVFSISNLLERFIETGATVFMGVGMMGLAMLSAPPSDRDGQHKLRVALMFPFTPEQQDAFEQRFGARVMAQLYGQTETGAIAYSRISEPRNLSSLGRPAPYFDVKLFDDEDGEVPVGQIGEIVVRPKVPNAIYQGYWRNPQATNETWRNLWHHTGDYGRADADGFITFVDRKKDALRRRGENVSSIEVEKAIVAHPKIAEAAVHAVPSEMSEDDIKACLVLDAGQTVEPTELFAFFKEHLPYFAIPRYVEILPELPKNATLRVMKHILRERGVTEETWDFDLLGLSVGASERR